MSGLPKIINRGPSQKEKLTEELHKLEAEIEALGTAVSVWQIGDKKARIEQIKKELAEMESPAGKLNAGTEKLNEMMAAREQAGMQLSPEQMAAIGAGRE